MGNTFTSSPPPVQHKPSEKYRGSYHLLCNESGFMQLRFREFFCEIEGLGLSLFKFFSLFRHCTYETYVEIIEILTKYEPQLFINIEAKEITSQTSLFDRFAMVVLNIWDVKAYLEHTSTQEEKLLLITRFFEVFTRKIDQHNVRKAYDYLDKQAHEAKRTKLFIEGFREQYPYSQQHLVSYYRSKFENVTKEYNGIGDLKSKILAIEDWIILSMKAPKIKENHPTLLFSADVHGISFSSLEGQIAGYPGPWLLVVTHYENDMDTKEKVRYVVGSYQSSGIKDIHTYQGSPECFLFKITPEIKYLVPSDGEGESNFFSLYNLNTTKHRRRGLGFGGRDFQNYKLWIDEDIEDKSYVNNGPDLTYGYGYIASPGTDKLKVRDIEIWALGTPENLQQQKNYKEERVEEATKRRKVNKQELMSGGVATELIFEKTFAHRDLVQGDIVHEDPKPKQGEKP